MEQQQQSNLNTELQDQAKKKTKMKLSLKGRQEEVAGNQGRGSQYTSKAERDKGNQKERKWPHNWIKDKTEQRERLNSNLKKGGGEQHTHRSSTHDQNKGFYRLKKKKGQDKDEGSGHKSKNKNEGGRQQKGEGVTIDRVEHRM